LITSLNRVVLDYISGMTDRFLYKEYKYAKEDSNEEK